MAETNGQEAEIQAQREADFRQGYARGAFDFGAHCPCFTCGERKRRLTEEAVADFRVGKSVAQVAAEKARIDAEEGSDLIGDDFLLVATAIGNTSALRERFLQAGRAAVAQAKAEGRDPIAAVEAIFAAVEAGDYAGIAAVFQAGAEAAEARVAREVDRETQEPAKDIPRPGQACDEEGNTFQAGHN